MNEGRSSGDAPFVNAYYFRAHSYTMVPRQIREDLEWMAAHGTDAVSLAVLEQDLFAAVENYEFVIDVAHDLGMEVHAVPSRWGGLVAGAPKVPSIFSAQNPQTWVRNEDGDPVESPVSGVLSSIHHPDTYEFVVDTLDEMLDTWEFDGVVWDEPKNFHRADHSEAARRALGPDPTREERIAANVEFFDRVNGHLATEHPDVTTSLFVYAQADETALDAFAGIEALDYYGCDGRPWPPAAGGQTEAEDKCLLGPGERYLDAAHEAGKGSLWLVENHNMAAEDVSLMQEYAADLQSKSVDHLIYYYYPRNLANPEANMDVVADVVTGFGE